MANTLQSDVGSSSMEVNVLLSNSGEEAGRQAVKMLLPNSTPDWSGAPDQVSSLEKAGFFGLKVLATVGATAAIILIPHVALPFLCHHLACSAAVTVVAKGAISGASTGVNEYLTIQMHGNYTPDPTKRQEVTENVARVKTAVIVSAALAGANVPAIKGAATLIETGAVFAYDLQPETANDTLDKIKNFFSFSKAA